MESDITGIDVRQRLRRVHSSISRYDLLLTVIPVALFGTAAIGRTVGASLETALLTGATVALFALIDGLFLRPPSGLQGA